VIRDAGAAVLPTARRVEIERGDGLRETHALVSGLAVGNADVTRIVTARGGIGARLRNRGRMEKALARSTNL
jgi:hypothetical protein